MRSLVGSTKSLERYEAYTLLADASRYLARTCVTDGAKKMLRKLANQFDREAVEVNGRALPALARDRRGPPKRAPSR